MKEPAMDIHLPPERVDQLIATAVRRGRRRLDLRRAASGAAALAVVAVIVVGAGTFLDRAGSGPAQTAATPAATAETRSQSEAPSSPASSPQTTASTELPSDPNATGDFSTYSTAEQELVLQHVSSILEGRDPTDFAAVVSRTTWVDGLAALSPDVEVTEADDSPALAVRIWGPLGEATRRGPLGGGGDQAAEVVGAFTLFGIDGQGYTSARLYRAPDGQATTMPPIDPRYEHEAAVIDLEQVGLPPLATAPSGLSDDQQATASQLVSLVEGLLPAGVELADVLSSSPDGAVFSLTGARGNARGMLALWHLTPGADPCLHSPDCSPVPVEDGTVYIDSTFDSPEAPAREYTYRRGDDTAIYFTLEEIEAATEPLYLPLADEQVVSLLTDPAWAPHLDRKKAEPPQ